MKTRLIAWVRRRLNHICLLQGFLPLLQLQSLLEKGFGTNQAGESCQASSKGASELFQSLFFVDKNVVLTKQPIFPSLTSSLPAIRYRSVG